MIAKLAEPENGLHWDNVIEKVGYSMNNTIHNSIKQRPSETLLGITQRGKVCDELKERIEESSYKIEVRKTLEDIRKEAEETQAHSQRKNEAY